MSKSTRTIFFVLSLIFTITATAQDPISDEGLIGDIMPPLPNAAALGEYVDFPVSLYTGIPNVTIPIHEMSGKSIQLPISLSYHGGGVKVSEQASWVGLGWSLNAGGVITRTVRGGPDYTDLQYSYPFSYYITNFDFDNYPERGMIEEEVPTVSIVNMLGYREPYLGLGEFGYLEEYRGEGGMCPGSSPYGCDIPTPVSFGYAETNDCATGDLTLYSVGCLDTPIPYMNDAAYNPLFYKIQHAYKRTLDLEPDMFSFNFMGYSGKFSFDKNGEVIYMGEEQQLIIERVGNLDSWIITATDGMKFFFEGAKESSTDYNTCNENLDSYAGLNYVSSWYLTKVVSPTNDEINLEYVPYVIADYQIIGGQSKNIPLKDIASELAANTLPQPPGSNSPCMTNRLNITAQRLSKIENNYGDKVEFLISNDERCDLPGDSALEYIRISKNAKVIKKIKLNHDNFEEVDNLNCGRLRLFSVEEGTEDDLGNFIGYGKEHGFEYNNEALPEVNSLARDRWGYYNGDFTTNSLYNSDLIIEPTGADAIIPEPSDYRIYDFRGNRNPNPDFMDAGILTKVNYPTGGNTTFQYEPNTYRLDGFKKVTAGISTGVLKKKIYTGHVTASGTVNKPYSDVFDFDVNDLPEKNRVMISGVEYGLMDFDVSVLCNQANMPGGTLGSCGPLARLINTTTGETILLADTSLDSEFTGIVQKLVPSGLYKVEAFVTALSPTNSGDFAQVAAYWEKYDYSQPIYEKIAGGMRVSNISAIDNSGSPAIVKEFEYKDTSGYSSGRLLSIDLYKSYHISQITPNGTTALPTPKAHYTISSDPKSSMASGNHIGYTQARIKYGVNGSNGWEDSYFSMAFDEAQGHFGFQYPFPPVLDNSIRRGNLIRSETFDAQGNRLSRIENTYDYEESGNVEGIKVGSRVSDGLFQYQTYLMKEYRKRMTSTLSFSYDLYGGSMDTETIYEYANHNRHSNPIKVTQFLGNGLSYTTETTFVQDLVSGAGASGDDATTALRNLYAKNIHVPIETRQYMSKPDMTNSGNIVKKLISGSIIEYFVGTDGFVLPKKIHRVETTAPISSTTFNASYVNTSGQFITDNAYEPQGTIVAYDPKGNVLEYMKSHHSPIAFIWNNEGRLPTAKITNAKKTEIFYTGFESEGETEDGNWNIFGASDRWTEGGIMGSHTGLSHFRLSDVDVVKATIVDMETNGQYYELSFWHKDNNIQVMKDLTQAEGITGTSGWTHFRMKIFLMHDDVITIKGNGAKIDELRLHPVDALMETYSYDPLTSQMVTSNTANNIASHYEYDNFHRLEYVRDQDMNIIQNYEYAYHSQSVDGKNKVVVRTVLTDGLVNEVNFLTEFATLSPSEKTESIQYMDGLGRGSQEIAIGQSISGNDIVSFHEYDSMGRETKQYLPFTIESNSGAFVDDAIGIQSQWYSSNPYNSDIDKKIAETTKPFSETLVEASPIGRVLKQGAAGVDWQINSGHTETHGYSINNGFQNVHDFQTGTSSNYAAGELSKITSVDENGNKTESFTDKQGRVILVRRVIVEVDGGISTPLVLKYADTYNVYNDFGLLEAVIPPKAVEYMKSNNNWNYNDKSIFGALCYYYEYDHRLRLESKRLPAKVEAVPNDGETRYFYDKRDQLVLTQDPNQQSTIPQTASFTKYDQLGRPVQTGIYTVPTGVDIQTEIESAVMPNETHTSSFSNGYTNQAFPSANKVYYTHTFYDDYDFNNDGTADLDYLPNQGAGIALPTNHFDRLDGQLTATKVRYEENGVAKWLTTATFYDYKMRTIQIRSQHHLGYWDTNSTAYDFSGKVKTTKRRHQNSSGQYTSYLEKFDYYNNGSLKDVRYKAKYDQEYIRSRNVYNELGQLMEKNLHADATETSFLQSIDYRYNIRGWLESINDTYAPSSTQNVYSLVKGGEYTIGFGTINSGEMNITLAKSIGCIPVGDTGLFDDIGEGDNVITVTIPSGTLVPTLSDITINLDDIADVNAYADIPDAIDELESTISSTLTAQQIGSIDDIVLPIIDELREMAKSTWYLVEDSYDLDDNDLYSQRLYYNQGNSSLGTTTGLAQYNGNISSTIWHIAGKEKRQMYAFEYDGLDRLVRADYGTVNITNGYIQGNRYSVPEIGYDLNGNILGLKRRGMDTSPNAPVPSTVIDDLTYSYDQNSNQLLGVQDAESIMEGFTEIDPAISIDYEYDENGNMIIDRNKDLEIEYNHLNLPIRFGWNNDGFGNFDKEIRILYDAAGVKLRKTVIDNTDTDPAVVKDYVGGIEYINGDLEAVYHADGRCVPRTGGYAEYTQNDDYMTTTGAFVYEYTIKDHLGNARLTFADLDKDGTINVDHNDASSTEIIQENHYYPFGMQHDMQSTQTGTKNDYTYNGKELNSDFDLNLSDYGARWYDASIGRWHSVDPLAEKYVAFSPYNYVLGNPIKNFDPDGMRVETEIYNEDGKKVGEDKNGKDGNVAVVSNKVGKKLKKGKMTAGTALASTNLKTTKTVIIEALDVLGRTEINGGDREEISIVSEDGIVTRGKTGKQRSDSKDDATVSIESVPGNNNTSIHSHPLNHKLEGNILYSNSALEPSDGSNGGPSDIENFKKHKQNVIVGRLGKPIVSTSDDPRFSGTTIKPAKLGAAFFDRNSNPQGTISKEAMEQIIK